MFNNFKIFCRLKISIFIQNTHFTANFHSKYTFHCQFFWSLNCATQGVCTPRLPPQPNHPSRHDLVSKALIHQLNLNCAMRMRVQFFEHKFIELQLV